MGAQDGTHSRQPAGMGTPGGGKGQAQCRNDLSISGRKHAVQGAYNAEGWSRSDSSSSVVISRRADPPRELPLPGGWRIRELMSGQLGPEHTLRAATPGQSPSEALHVLGTPTELEAGRQHPEELGCQEKTGHREMASPSLLPSKSDTNASSWRSRICTQTPDLREFGEFIVNLEHGRH